MEGKKMLKKQQSLILGLTLILLSCLPAPGQDLEVGPLVSLTLSEGALKPGFSPGRTQYWVRVDFVVECLAFTPVGKDPEAGISIAGWPVRSGQSSPPLPLVLGRNIIAVEVRGKDGTADFVYKINVTR